MDINDIRAVLTLLGFFLFCGVVFWAYSRGAQPGFDEAQALLADDDTPAH
jgi:cbb3-type cytochrome oxidase subunit 3